MRVRYRSHFWMTILSALLLAGCTSDRSGTTTPNINVNTEPERPCASVPLSDNGYKAKITLNDPPAKLRAGEKQIIQVKVQNASDVLWKVRGCGDDNKFYIAAGNQWLKAEGELLVTRMDGRHGLPDNLKPGQDAEVPLQITAPKEPGEYILEVDLVQEQVAWFSDKGSPTAKVKVAVVQ
ncbi:MAG: hypothetical protein ND866_23245 [Pyrinomonadaceae bacterium]|nr:hypothetical protein [Pyrinomonadaceae bacterium]